MNSFHRFLAYSVLCGMVLGMVNVSIASPLPRGNSVMASTSGGFDSIKPKKFDASNRRTGASRGGCWHHSSRGSDLYFFTLKESNGDDCSSRFGEETAEMYAPGCTNLSASGNRMPSGQCGVDEQSVTNFGNLIVHSSDRVLGRVDLLMNSAESDNPLATVVSDSQSESKSWNRLSPSIVLSHVPMGKAFRYDRLSQDWFDDEEYDVDSPDFSFDHQLVMSGKVAHLVPKAEQGRRTLELGDLVILLLFAMVPEKRHIKHLIHRTRQFRLF